jgi:hypothetical protein
VDINRYIRASVVVLLIGLVCAATLVAPAAGVASREV